MPPKRKYLRGTRPNPAQPTAKFVTYCKDCGQTLIRFPSFNGKAGGELAHALVRLNEVTGLMDVSGWTLQCPKNSLVYMAGSKDAD